MIDIHKKIYYVLISWLIVITIYSCDYLKSYLELNY